MLRRSSSFLGLLVLGSLLLGLAPVAAAQTPAPAGPSSVTPQGELGGGLALTRERSAALRLQAPLAATNMTFHTGGTVMRGPVKVFTIYWQSPTAGYSFPANFIARNNQFVNDLNQSSFYNIVTQYSDAGGNIGNQISLAGTWTDTTNTFPNTALTSGNLQTEMNNAITANGWTSDANSFFEIFTPSSDGTVTAITNSTTGICGIHYFANPAFGHILDLGVPGSCDPGGPYPNGRLIDEAINTSSHEIIETVTDPLGDAWFYLNAAGEIGDLCNFNFGPRIASDGADITLGGRRYLAQQEWSNAISGCAVRYNANVDVSVAKTSAAGTVVAGNNVSYTITVSNPSGSWESSDIQLSDTLPTGTTFQSLTSPVSGTACTTPAVNGTGTVSCVINSLPANGQAVFTLVLKVTSAPPGNLSNTASVTYTSGTPNPNTNTSTATISVKRSTTLVYTGDTTQDYHDSTHLSAILTDTLSGAPISGKAISFALGTQAGSGTTSASGVAFTDIVINQAAGGVTVSATYGGDSGFLASSSGPTAYTITREETTIVYTGDTVIANGGTAHLSAVLKEDGTTPISGRTVTLTLGSGGSAQTCIAVTDSTGVAACSVSPVSQPLGPGTVGASFAGDAFYLPANNSATTIMFAFLTRGAFVVGNQSATGPVTFWGAQWAKQNLLTGGDAPSSFKGFANSLSVTPPVCGDNWSTDPGNSSGPPASVPSYMGVLVSSSVSQSGSSIAGDTVSIVVVRTDPGYGANPGHSGTGTVVAVYCK